MTSKVLRARRAGAALASICGFLALCPSVVGAVALQLDAMTGPELQARIAAGATTVLVPIGGTEQNGPHMALGKHNLRVQRLAERIAERLGQAVVAPLVAYVPEGSIDPPSGHMRFSGTISIPVAAFESVLEGAARSLCQHGLHDVVLLGDHGGYRDSLARVAARVGSAGRCRVHALPEYYRLSSADHARWLSERGHASAEIGRHAGLADTSLMMAIDRSMVRADALAGASGAPGVDGDPRQASAVLGEAAVERIVEGSVVALRAALARGRPRQRTP